MALDGFVEISLREFVEQGYKVGWVKVAHSLGFPHDLFQFDIVTSDWEVRGGGYNSRTFACTADTKVFIAEGEYKAPEYKTVNSWQEFLSKVSIKIDWAYIPKDIVKIVGNLWVVKVKFLDLDLEYFRDKKAWYVIVNNRKYKISNPPDTDVVYIIVDQRTTKGLHRMMNDKVYASPYAAIDAAKGME